MKMDEKTDRKLEVILKGFLVMVLFLSGCSLSLGVNADADTYWPNMKTAKGGSFGDPSESRHEAMRPSRGSTRNNEQNAVDRFLYRLSGQEQKIK